MPEGTVTVQLSSVQVAVTQVATSSSGALESVMVSDIFVDMGATTVMSESIEWIGGEHILAKRAATTDIHNEIIEVCREYESHLSAAGQDCRAGQPTPGNKAGGLSTLEVIVFTTGRGTPTGNAIAPVLKVTANERTFRMMEDNMDVDLSAVLRGEKSIAQMGYELVCSVAEVSNGRMTKAEAFQKNFTISSKGLCCGCLGS